MNAQSARRVIRTVLQFVAGGGLFALQQQVLGDVDASYAPYIVIAYGLGVSIAQNVLESTTDLPAIFKGDASGAKNPKPIIGPK